MKRCLRCNTKNDITRDHIVPKSALKLLLDRDEYAKFSTQSRYCNIQPLCGPCNNAKGWRAIDFRPHGDDGRRALHELISEWGLSVDWVREEEIEWY